ncbi:MAG TPA: hypothetical protein VFH54_06135 [Mycobacteriales bacterium]|nr:hypothetical protein [Mycobacteriales bacterium]
MAGTALADAIDYLVTLFTNAVNNLDQGSGPAQVYDGYPGTDRTADFIVVGTGSDADASTAAQRGYVELGGTNAPGSLGEEFVVVNYVQAFRRNVDYAQSEARRAAVALYALCETALRNDPTLGGLTTPFPAEISTQNLKQTTPETANEGRWALIEFGVLIKHRY